MHILLTNDDGPPSHQSSPYVQTLVSVLQSGGHTVSVVLPDVQRSWIGKAHMVGQMLTPSYYRPGAILQDNGITQSRPFNDGKEEWVLLDGTPASCAQIGLYHLFNDRGPVDLVISGPNYGRNTTAVFALSSGTIGAAMEGALAGKKSIALSFAFDSREHDSEIIAGASRISLKLVEKLVREWPADVHVYSINVPVRRDVESTQIFFTDMLQNQWTSGSSFSVVAEDTADADPNVEEQQIRSPDNEKNVNKSLQPKRNHVSFKWAPNFADVRKAVEDAKRGDGWHVIQGHVTVTPLRANFWHLPHYTGEIKLDDVPKASVTPYAVVAYPEPYVQPLIEQALLDSSIPFQIVASLSDLPDQLAPSVQFMAYESLAFDIAVKNPSKALCCAYVIRKALIRKHYLSNTIATWLVKHPQSVLSRHFKPSVHFELDYAEFLDEALVDAWDLNESMERNKDNNGNSSREWWILKPGMSDGGNGIRLFSSLDQLQAVFEEWDGDDGDDDDVDDDDDDDKRPEQGSFRGAMTSQLRHFLAQPYIDPPLLLPSYDNRKFHIRAYVVAVGALKVFVYRDMLALFAAKPYEQPKSADTVAQIDLGQHLTNTCFQNENTRDSSVQGFWALQDSCLNSERQDEIFEQICQVTGEVFEAAAREQVVHFQVMPNALEIFGVDFLVDAAFNVWLLEINAYPDFKQTGPSLQPLIAGLFGDVVRVGVEPFFGYRRHENGTAKLRLVKDIDMGR